MRGILFLAMSLIGGGSALADERLDRKPKKTREFDIIQYFPQDGREVSFGGDRLVWTGEGDCSQNEGMEPIISVQGDGVTIRNAWIDESPDGIHVSGDRVVIENVVFPKVCEDAITVNGGNDVIIRNCAFRGARDKAIQINAGKNVLIEDCYFEDCAKPVRVKAGATVTVRNNVSRDSVVFVLADGEGAEVGVEGNDVDESKWFVKAQKDAVIAVGENSVRRIAERDLGEKGGEIVRLTE